MWYVFARGGGTMGTAACVAMILAGGKGERLGALTHYYSKPAIHFGRNGRLIDFTLKNCIDSGIRAIGILSQYFSTDLHAYIDAEYGGKDNSVYMLPSRSNDHHYRGTGDAVYKNIEFIDNINPECVLILASDHVYGMDYNSIIKFHKEADADATVASIPVQSRDAHRYGIITAGLSGRVFCFEEKPARPKSLTASMGIYCFKWSSLKKYLRLDAEKHLTTHDFGRDILPDMIDSGESVYTYRYNGYWRDVGTLDSLWEANMEFIGNCGCVSDEATVLGTEEHSVICEQVTVGTGSEIINSIVMPGAYIGDNVRISNTIVGSRAIIMNGVVIGDDSGENYFVDRKVCPRGISLVSPWLHIPEGMRFQSGSHIYKERLREWMPEMAAVDEFSYYRPDRKYASFA